MPDHGSFASRSGAVVDRRRAMRLAERIASGNADPLGTGVLPPGIVTHDHASIGQLLASGIEFDRAAFAYDVTGYTAYTCNGAGQAGSPKWTKVGARPNNLRVALGPITQPTYFWIWSTFGWANNGTADAGRSVACFYDSLTPANTAIGRANNPQSDWKPADNNFRQNSYIGFLGIDPDDTSILSLQTGEGDWNIGMQQQYSGLQNVGNTSVNRQSIIVFATAIDAAAPGNWTVDNTLD